MKTIKYDNKDYVVIEEKENRIVCETTETSNPFVVMNGNKAYVYNSYISEHIKNNGFCFYSMNERAEYFNNKNFCIKLLKNFELYRRILKYAYDNSALVDWRNEEGYIIVYDMIDNMYCVEPVVDTAYSMNVVFDTIEAAENCIKEVILPFIKDNKECGYV